jgi:hypothetical protein
MRIQKPNLFVTWIGLLAAGAPACAAPPPWVSRDIGVWSVPGSVEVDARGLWTMRANQGNEYLSPDSFFFVYQPLSGDGSVLAYTLWQDGGGPEWGKLGVSIMEKESARARGAHLQVTTGHGTAVIYRVVEIVPTVTEAGDRRYGPRAFPMWLRMQREGDRFTPFASPDGYGWTQLRSPITLGGFATTALAGISVSSGAATPITGFFSNPTVAPGQISPLVQTRTGSGTVLLSWPRVSGAVAYLVRRSAQNASTFTADLLTPDPIADTSFTDSNLLNGRPLRYLVSPVFEQGGQRVEGWATAVTATPVATPANLFGTDIDLEASRLAGAIAFDPAAGIYKVSGSGSDVGDTEDHCFFASQLVKGDFQITVRLLNRPSRTNTGARAGLMLRESLDGPARMAFLAGSAASGVTFQIRRQNGVATPLNVVVGDREFKPPLVLRLLRRGATVTSYISTNGSTFQQVGLPRTFDTPLPESLYVGYAITSQNPGALTTNTFTDLTLEPR